ncbi:hypothetical protein V6N11_000069 [Hibiscus sabdariffa]|uniref:Ferric oxidoreductase domain-containing protein n=1 Tax=Hibiscus sabdariffa TaxID=183260 RepID=A0ABR2NNI3_9ROSI
MRRGGADPGSGPGRSAGLPWPKRRRFGGARAKLGIHNDNINFHKVVAFGIAIGVGLHAGAHLTCDYPRLLHATDKEYEPMEQFFGEERPGNYWWFVKGTEGWTGVTMVALLAQPWFHRNRLNLPKPIKKLTGFNALFIVHGYYLYLSKKWYKKTLLLLILEVAVCPGNVLSLHLTKPQRVKYTSGQYILRWCLPIPMHRQRRARQHQTTKRDRRRHRNNRRSQEHAKAVRHETSLLLLGHSRARLIRVINEVAEYDRDRVIELRN